MDRTVLSPGHSQYVLPAVPSGSILLVAEGAAVTLTALHSNKDMDSAAIRAPPGTTVFLAANTELAIVTDSQQEAVLYRAHANLGTQ